MFYITDQRHNGVVEVKTLDEGSGWRELKAPPWVGDFREPAGISLGSRSELIVADRGNHRVVLFEPDGGSAAVLVPPAGTIGSLWNPTGVVSGPSGEVFVADTGNHRIVCSESGSTEWTAFGSPGHGIGQFVAPTGIVTDPEGRLVIADPGAARLVRIDAMDGHGWTEIPLTAFGPGSLPYGLSRGLGGILISDVGTARILLLGPGSVVSGIIDGATQHSFIRPIAAVEYEGGVVVADPAGASITLFEQKSSHDGLMWRVTKRLSGRPGAVPSPPFPRIGGFTVGDLA
jgi:NHL repeat